MWLKVGSLRCSANNVEMTIDCYGSLKMTVSRKRPLYWCSKIGSVDQSPIKHVFSHRNRYVRQFVPKSLRYCLTLDVHASRGVTEWIYYCNENKIRRRLVTQSNFCSRVTSTWTKSANIRHAWTEIFWRSTPIVPVYMFRWCWPWWRTILLIIYQSSQALLRVIFGLWITISQYHTRKIT